MFEQSVVDRGVPSRVRVEINLNTIAENAAKIKQHVGSNCRLLAVMKANAYGLGVKSVARFLVDKGDVGGFGVAEMKEAMELLEFGLPIQVLGNLLPYEVEFAVRHELLIPLVSLEMAQIISREAGRQHKLARCHIAIDSGMGRLGVLLNQAREIIPQMVKLPNLKCVGIYSHFPCAYICRDQGSINQIDNMKKLIADLAHDGIHFEYCHMAASDAVSNYPESFAAPFNQCRVGLNLYGYYDGGVEHSMQLNSAVELKTNLAAIRQLPAGTSIGYGRTYNMLLPGRVGVIAAGYADGLPLALSNRGFVLIRGRFCPVIGRISMDYTTVALDLVPDAEYGDEVTLIGRQKENSIGLENWAQLKNTHAYDILCSFGSRVERIYLK